MARPDKAAAVAELTDAFRDSPAAVLTEYRGLSVAELKELRRSLAGNATYSVVKNTLAKIAARAAGIDAFESLLVGPSAIAFVSGDAVEVAKGLRAFGKDHPNLVVKGGILDGKALSADEIRTLADLESREVLLAKLVGGFAAPATQFVSVLAAPVRQLAQLLGALQAKAEADPTWARGDDGATALEPEVTDDVAPQPEAAADAEEPASPDEAAPADSAPATSAETSTDSPSDEPSTEDNPTDGAADASSER